MIIMITGIVFGILLGALVFLATRQKPVLLGWAVVGLGVFALIAILPSLLAVLGPVTVMINPGFSIVLGLASLISGIGAIVITHHRAWQVWLGLALGIVPILFWLWFITAEILYPH